MSKGRRTLNNNVFAYKIRESDKHYKGKLRLYNLFKSLGYETHKEVPSQERLESGEIKGYVFDVLVCGRFVDSNSPVYVILEVDGRKGHRTGITDNKAAIRDDHFLTKYKIPTVRFPVEYLHGRDRINDDLIIREVEYWIKSYWGQVLLQDKKIYSKKAKCCRCGHFSNVHTFSGCMVCECEYGYIHEIQ